MSAYVITQWYRPPEVVLGIQDLREYKTAQKFELAYSEKGMFIQGQIGTVLIRFYSRMLHKIENVYYIMGKISVDVWSIGCILAEMITGDVLFKVIFIWCFAI